MADLILKTSAGKIWKSPAGKILKAKALSETMIQSGLICSLEPNNITNIGGECAGWEDSIGNYDLIQNNVANRPIIETVDSIYPCVRSNDIIDYLSFTSNVTFRTMVFVFKFNFRGRFIYESAQSIGSIGIGIPFSVFQISWQTANLIKLNGAVYTLNNAKAYGKYIVIAKFPSNVTLSTTNRLFNSQTNNNETDITGQYMYFGFYNKYTNDLEDNYNTNALALRYNITL